MERRRSDMLLTHIQVELAGTRSELARGLQGLAREVAEASAALASGARINAGLIANYAMMTANIDRWNTLRGVLPYLAEDDSAK